MKKLALVLALGLSFTVQAQDWKYEERVDTMTDHKQYSALISASNFTGYSFEPTNLSANCLGFGLYFSVDTGVIATPDTLLSVQVRVDKNDPITIRNKAYMIGYDTASFDPTEQLLDQMIKGNEILINVYPDGSSEMTMLKFPLKGFTSSMKKLLLHCK